MSHSDVIVLGPWECMKNGGIMRAIFTALVVFSLSFCSSANADELSHRAAAEELLKLKKTDQIMRPLFEQMGSLMEQQFKLMGVPENQRPTLIKYTDKLLSLLEEQFGWEKIKNDYITVYTETFTEDELKAISAFYKTPVGQMYIEKMPVLMKHSMEISQKNMPGFIKSMQQIRAKMLQEMKDEIERKSDKESGESPAKKEL